MIHSEQALEILNLEASSKKQNRHVILLRSETRVHLIFKVCQITTFKVLLKAPLLVVKLATKLRTLKNFSNASFVLVSLMSLLCVHPAVNLLVETV